MDLLTTDPSTLSKADQKAALVTLLTDIRDTLTMTAKSKQRLPLLHASRVRARSCFLISLQWLTINWS